MTIRFFNTLLGKLEEFKPLEAARVRLYTCGPTVYDTAHIGNFRTFVFEDLLRRFLEFKGLKVEHVMNITDVDDKTIAGANNAGADLQNYTAQYTAAFLEDLKTLNILPPTRMPRATEEIPSMLALIETLVKKDAAYVSDGSVYYRVAKFPGYGKLSKKKLEKNISGARVDVDAYEKEEGADFALWKKSKEGEPSWDSPWGRGRPGWHIECSAMSMKYLGETFDIHAGGEDLIFPHHENEIAQSEAATGKPFVKTWLHSKFLLVNGEKMSKSKGNFYTLRDLLAKGYDPAAIRYTLLSTHYRTPLNFTEDGLKKAGEVIKRLDECYWECLNVGATHASPSDESARHASPLHQDLPAILNNIAESLSNDLNISPALAHLNEGVSLLNREKNYVAALDFFEKIDRLFGFDIARYKEIPVEVLSQLKVLQEFRLNKNYGESDRIRTELKSSGWLVKDSRPGEPSTVKKMRRAWNKK